MIKTRIEEKANYKSVWVNGKTLRFAIDSSKPITELEWPEFYDIKITGKCNADPLCKFCYMASTNDVPHYDNITGKLRTFFSSIPQEHLPYQIAYGGGEPTSHPDFAEAMRITKEEFDVCPNYTTNGMWVSGNDCDPEEIINATKEYCGGVAVSCHPHLEYYWQKAAREYSNCNIKLNFHIIISDKESINYFRKIYDEWKNDIDYFVLLPYGVQGRAVKKEIDWDYLVEQLPEDHTKLAFGANFYPYLKRGNHNIKVSLYPPEIFSKFMDLKDMKIYPSSFSIDKPLN